MKHQISDLLSSGLLTCLGLLTFGLLTFSSCSKVEYRKIDEPAYIRVFNNLTYKLTLENQEDPLPFLTMLIDPVLDETGIPVEAAIVGDHLDQRVDYAAPFQPVVDNTYRNYEFPGKEDILRGPILNGFDLSSWAQVPSGEHRVMFYSRPQSEVPFFQLETRLRNRLILDTTVQLQAQEVYTWHILQKNFNTKENMLYVRQENFHKLPLSDSLVYVNFYNLSAEGFLQAPESLKPDESMASGALSFGMADNMNIYLSLHKKGPGNGSSWGNYIVGGYKFAFLGSVQRNTESAQPAPYYSFPLFADPESDGITTDMFQYFRLLAPGLDPNMSDNNNPPNGDGVMITCLSPNGVPERPVSAASRNYTPLHNLIIQLHSGIYNPRSFATVNSIEIVNGKAYLTTNQRNYPPPIY